MGALAYTAQSQRPKSAGSQKLIRSLYNAYSAFKLTFSQPLATLRQSISAKRRTQRI